jgi:hypothetical protein
VADAQAANWVAKGTYFADLAKARRQRALEADVANWLAKAEFYAEQTAAGR